ncbi:hypothetical protein QTP70_019308 [Hemibagrus guttatus]|uniref:ATP-citrate synthase ATP-grasp domain-containing protein n=1 Tax=Hemibagrus guttatus TaxID=175788 RepID=A0AAE0UHA8_9TELE|nr:hypothetical protein QTP70_019308 [Hemibagrus guttatus]
MAVVVNPGLDRSDGVNNAAVPLFSLTHTRVQRLVVKPDQLIKRRGKLGLVGVDLDLQGVHDWLVVYDERNHSKSCVEGGVGKVKGILKKFLIEPFVPHSQEEEFYMCIYATREGDHVLFHHEGGVDIGDVDSKAQHLMVGVDEKLTADAVTEQLLTHVPDEKKETLLQVMVSGAELMQPV